MDIIIEYKKKMGRPKIYDIPDEGIVRNHKVSMLINKNRYNNDPEYKQTIRERNALFYQKKKQLKKINIETLNLE